MDAQLNSPLSWTDLAILAPEIMLVIAAVILSLTDLLLPRRVNREWIGFMSLAGVLVSLGFVVWRVIDRYEQVSAGNNAATIQLLNTSYRVDDFALFVKIILLVGTACVILMSIGSMKDEDLPHRGEYYYLLLPATLGAMIMASSGDLITLYVGLELLSITSYIMVAMKKHDSRSTEGAFKYLVLGSVASSFILYGMSFLYGMTGSTQLVEIAIMLSAPVSVLESFQYDTMIYLSFLLLIVGLGFKVAAAPFHAWSPDVYQGAPTPITAFLSVVAKGASLALLFRLFYSSFAPIDPNRVMNQDFSIILLSIAALSMVVGTTMALRQNNVKRLLALSGIANAGYLIVPIGLDIFRPDVVVYSSVFTSFWFYLTAYLAATMGAFAVLLPISRATGHDEMKGFAGLYYRKPWLAVAMTVFVLSLAGIPITAGFFGKLYIILAAVSTNAAWVAVVMMITSVISFYFYFGFIRQMYMRQDEEAAIKVPVTQGIVIGLCVLLVIGLGLFPNALLDVVNTLFTIFDDLIIE